MKIIKILLLCAVMSIAQNKTNNIPSENKINLKEFEMNYETSGDKLKFLETQKVETHIALDNSKNAENQATAKFF